MIIKTTEDPRRQIVIREHSLTPVADEANFDGLYIRTKDKTTHCPRSLEEEAQTQPYLAPKLRQVHSHNLGVCHDPQSSAVNALQDCKQAITSTNNDLEKSVQEIHGKLEALVIQNQKILHGNYTPTSVFKDVLAAPYSHQVITTTKGNTISATGVTAGVGARQWLGHISDAALQEQF
jgi:hypothetical protein